MDSMKLAATAALSQKVNAATKRVTAKFIDREDVVKATFLALISDCAAFFLSPPGTGKTATVGELARQIRGLEFFEALMPGVPTPDQLFVESTEIVESTTPDGGKSIRVSQKLGRAAKAHLFFADEIWKTDPSVLNPLLDLARADGIRHEGEFVETPILGFLGASNELPDADGNLGALWSRMILRVHVRSLDATGRKAMVRARLAGFKNGNAPEAAPELNVEDIHALQTARPFVDLPDAIVDTVLDVIQQLVSADADAFTWLAEDDRRFGFICDVLQAHALMNGRTVVTTADLGVLRWLLWDKPEQIPQVEGIVNPLCRTPIGECRELLDGLLQPGGTVAEVVSGTSTQAVKALQQVNACKAELNGKLGELSGADAERVRDWVTALTSLGTVIAMAAAGAFNKADAEAAFNGLRNQLN